MNFRTYTAVVKVRVEDSLLDELITDGIEGYDHVESVINDYLADRGYLANTQAYEGDLAPVLNEYAVLTLNQMAVEALQREILESKQCINGTCED
jgi:hypothetical protein